MNPPPTDRLPDGFTVVLGPGVERRDGGTALLGGSPARLLRLAPAAQELLVGDRLAVTDARSAALAGRLLDAGVAVPEVPAVSRPDVTVVVPVKDRTDGLARLLAALRADPGTAGCPVVVVDDGSADPAAVAAVAGGTRLLRHEHARGPAAARNAGLRVADTDAVAFVDSDCVPEAGWLATLAGHLADPRLAVVAPRITALDPAQPGWVARYEALDSALDMGPAAARVAPGTGVSYVPSAALLARRTALADGFDEAMPVAEDVDLVWRLSGAGWRVRYEPAARVAHDHRVELGDWLRRRAFYGTGAALLAQRHGAAVAPLVISPWSLAAWVLPAFAGRWGLLGSLGVLGRASVLLARRVAVPGRPLPIGWAAGLVLRGTASSGRALARTVTRHHWPLTVAVALVSRRARRAAGAVAVADAVAGWWPHRREIDLPAFAAGRRLEDLAYGAGLWSGALRARNGRALLPAAPEPVAPRG
ncbi:mycofactocin biosynthesis glycosyltransferase MftF [Modestobacter sp. VKM Ac-2979]|uniref:mycofactocin biosynthesis glycosyltransferase MftF n=1 Tax=unclassified Modestobacter TaxID=2643866 RepID=UPI0022AB544F|nr:MULTISPECIES: mycofactocin biosynthesis glycosyltransferase MftF [unclassified Modestobacter]MCZ2811122.1 mycofactocin biosynthesis glycosyltransferase MftF [Modestobacter sp. VKM Ac-2979]MCZ2840635.1 mycofactocin biosynthesis glycosyltransferase MftF [Modestobacter sp. VKM Ac-2980]